MNKQWCGITLLLIGVLVLATSTAYGWDEEGHIIVTRLAHHKLPDRIPEWVRSTKACDRLAYLCNEPDRWRGQKSTDLEHCNDPDHYFDADHLPQYDLTLKTLPPLRREFTDLLATIRAKHPDRFEPYDREKDKYYTQLVPGLLPYHVAEMQWKIAASWTTLKTYEANREYVSNDTIEYARDNIIFEMGLLAHFVGDGSQPLHATMHHHGWVGANPNGYFTDKKFHAEIDGGVIALHHITPSSLMERAKSPRPVSKDKYFSDFCDYLDETSKCVVPLYELKKSGELDKASGKQFIENRLLEGGAMLSGVWIAAYDGAHIDDFRVKQLKNNGKKSGMPATSQPREPD